MLRLRSPHLLTRGVSPIWPISAVSLIAGPNTLIGLAVSLIDVENCLFRGCGNCAWEPRKSRGFRLTAWRETTKFPRWPAKTGNLETGSLQTTPSASLASQVVSKTVEKKVYREFFCLYTFHAVPQPVTLDLGEVADRCSYHGSLEHKDKRSWLGRPRPRWRPRDVATICPLVNPEERDMATEWVREAIHNGQFDTAQELRNGFPRYIG